MRLNIHIFIPLLILAFQLGTVRSQSSACTQLCEEGGGGGAITSPWLNSRLSPIPESGKGIPPSWLRTGSWKSGNKGGGARSSGLMGPGGKPSAGIPPSWLRDVHEPIVPDGGIGPPTWLPPLIGIEPNEKSRPGKGRSLRGRNGWDPVEPEGIWEPDPGGGDGWRPIDPPGPCCTGCGGCTDPPGPPIIVKPPTPVEPPPPPKPRPTPPTPRPPRPKPPPNSGEYWSNWEILGKPIGQWHPSSSWDWFGKPTPTGEVWPPSKWDIFGKPTPSGSGSGSGGGCMFCSFFGHSKPSTWNRYK